MAGKMEKTGKINIEQFWKSIFILLKNHHAIQKKLAGLKIIAVYKVRENLESIKNILVLKDSLIWLESKNIQKWSNYNTEEIENFKEDSNLKGLVIHSKFILKSCNTDDLNVSEFPSGLQILDFESTEYCLKSFSDVLSSYTITLDPTGNFNIKVNSTNSKKLKLEENWANFYFKPKLFKWSADRLDHKQTLKSLNLIELEQYVRTYNELKRKYVDHIKSFWTESTDPVKFIHEDVAIAAYLICLWKSNKKEPTKFLDLGCGNGLLVYFLNQCGFNGYGIDVRKRKIWDQYPNSIKLVEQTIVPNNFRYDDDVDWIIGNHSDELSPWIPVLTVRSNYYTNFFLLPCCAFEFSGEKYQRRNCKTSVYNDFIDYVEIISKKCGFKVMKDRLKIPSTKRIALIGMEKSYELTDYEKFKESTELFVDNEMTGSKVKLRSKIEPVLNCTQIDKNILNYLVLKIFNLILQQDHKSSDEWQEGGKIFFRDLANLLTSEDLKQIKSQCGGLKTLLKNHHQIFLVLGDCVQIRRPESLKDIAKEHLIKKKSCFFHVHHPNGCLLSKEMCSFKHENI